MITFKQVASRIPVSDFRKEYLRPLPIPDFYQDAFKSHPTLTLLLRDRVLAEASALPGADIGKINRQRDVISKFYQVKNQTDPIKRLLLTFQIIKSEPFVRLGVTLLSKPYSAEDLIQDHEKKQTCAAFALDPLSIDIMTSDHFFKPVSEIHGLLFGKGWVQTQRPVAGDIVFYYPNSDASKLSHVGRVVRVDLGAEGRDNVVVQSKFGIGEAYEHPVELVLPGFGTHAGFYTSSQNVKLGGLTSSQMTTWALPTPSNLFSQASLGIDAIRILHEMFRITFPNLLTRFRSLKIFAPSSRPLSLPPEGGPEMSKKEI